MNLIYIFDGLKSICFFAGCYFLFLQYEKWYIKQKIAFYDETFYTRAPHNEKNINDNQLNVNNKVKWRIYFLLRFIPYFILIIIISWLTGKYGFAWLN